MVADARRDFLRQFRPDGVGIGFAVLVGEFALAVDLTGTRPVGAFNAALGLPPVVRHQPRQVLDLPGATSQVRHCSKDT